MSQGFINQQIASGPNSSITSLLGLSQTQAILATTTNNNAAVGYVGEFVTIHIPSASALTLNGSTPTNVTSISLTAGDWDVWGNLYFAPAGGEYKYQGWISLTSATLPDNSLLAGTQEGVGFAAYYGFGVPAIRVILSVTTTVYLSAQCVVTNTTACGTLSARRAR